MIGILIIYYQNNISSLSWLGLVQKYCNNLHGWFSACKSKTLNIIYINFILFASSHPFSYQEFIKTWFWYLSVYIILPSSQNLLIFLLTFLSVAIKLLRRCLIRKDKGKNQERCTSLQIWGIIIYQSSCCISFNLYFSTAYKRISQDFHKDLDMGHTCLTATLLMKERKPIQWTCFSRTCAGFWQP